MGVLVTVPDVCMLAGESSGDLLGALLLKGLKPRYPELRFGGIGGPQMIALGFDSQVPIDRLAVRGYAEVLRRLPALLHLRKSLARELSTYKPRVFLGIDAPDFNLGLEQQLRQQGVRTLHLVCPSIWAWRAERAEKIERAVDHMLCVFPFEEVLLEKLGITATYVGHPLADMIPIMPDMAQARATLQLPLEGRVIALLPGSRRDEIAHLAPRFLKAAELIRTKEPGAQFLIPAAGAERKAELERILQQFRQLPVRLVDGMSHTVLEASDGVLVASGTATLEAALYKKPMVIAYAMPALSWWMMKDKGYLPYVGLPNILAGQFLVPELLQDKATPQALAAALIEQMRDRTLGEQRLDHYVRMHHALKRDFSTAASNVLARYL
jgi:lipid-A-disaccharide synthase